MPQSIQFTDVDIDAAEGLLGYRFDEERREVLRCSTTVDIQAGPGTGKTSLLVAKLVLLGSAWRWRDRGVCVISHTNVARREIEQRLLPGYTRFLSYPHFVGTIQSFIDRFLAIPYLRAQGAASTHVDDDRFGALALRRLKDYPTANNYLNRRNQATWPAIVKGLHYEGPNLDLGSAADGTIPGPTAPSHNELAALKAQLSADGYFRYDDMYAFAQVYARNHPWIVEVLQHRFPRVLVDEVQDNSPLQDRLIETLFGQGCVLQRFGDINQDIYAVKSSTPRGLSFPRQSFLGVAKSIRFGPSIASFASRLSVEHDQRLVGNEERAERAHTVFLFDQKTIHRVIPSFGDLLLQEYPDGFPERFRAKAVGARKNEPVEGATRHFPYNVNDYWPLFEPDLGTASSNPGSLVGYVRKARHLRDLTGECGEPYTTLMDGVVKFLWRQDAVNEDGARFNPHSLKRALKKQESLAGFQELLLRLCVSKEQLDRVFWTDVIRQVLEVLRPWAMPLKQDAKEFLLWDEEDFEPTAAQPQRNDRLNIYRHQYLDRWVDIHVATVHTVKGETHHATLFLETFKDSHDLQKLLPYLVDLPKPRPKTLGVELRDHMHRAFVAITRPMDLVCLAILKTHVDTDYAAALQSAGWQIKDITFTPLDPSTLNTKVVPLQPALF